MNEKFDFDQMVENKEQHYSDKGFINKIASSGGKLGSKALHAAATLFVALKSDEMPTSSKLIVLGALGYFILPLDLIVDVLPLVGLSDDVFVITAALAKVYMSITDEMKADADTLLHEKLGDRYKG